MSCIKYSGHGAHRPLPTYGTSITLKILHWAVKSATRDTFPEERPDITAALFINQVRRDCGVAVAFAPLISK